MAVPGRPLEPDVVIPADVIHGWESACSSHLMSSKGWKTSGSRKSLGRTGTATLTKAEVSTREARWLW
eukprot:12096588-Heterocapsa_arctica.AAC.1